jgi:hypothetical protein
MTPPSAPPRSKPCIEQLLSPAELAAAREFVHRVIACVPAQLHSAYLFGSKARRQARPDSDVDVLLVFRRLPHDREPQASMAEDVAAQVVRETGVPVQTWSVSLVDLERGNRTPMLVDALDDGVPLWPRGARSIRIAFTPADALRCTRALLARVSEGSREAGLARRSGDWERAERRGRDDLVRLCTAALLLCGETRPRFADCIRRFRERFGGRAVAGELGGFAANEAVFRWAEGSFGATGKDDEAPVPPCLGGFAAIAREVEALRGFVRLLARDLNRRAG